MSEIFDDYPSLAHTTQVSLRNALEHVADGVLVTDTAGRIVYVNTAVAEVVGCDASDLRGHVLFDVFPEIADSVFSEQYRRMMLSKTPVSFTAYYERYNLWLEVRGFPSLEGATILLTDITERVRAEDALRESDHVKEEFLAVLSHELQTPLTSMLGWSEMALLQDSMELYQRAMPVIHRNARRQQRLINELLDMSRLLHGRLACEPHAIEFVNLIRGVASAMEASAADAGLTVALIPAADTLPITADAGRIRQCVEHLLSNSLKFTAAGGTVTLRWWRDDTTAYFAVHDTGRGIAPDAVLSLFTPFAQVDRDETAGGLGLGLAITRGIMELHGGSVTAASAGIGLGSTFTLSLPLATESRN